jgi:HSP20 family protein
MERTRTGGQEAMIVTRIRPTRPWDWGLTDFDQMRRDVARLAETFAHGPFAGTGAQMFPLVNVTQDDDNFYVRAELPGVKPSDLSVSVVDNKLSISGTRDLPAEGENVSYHRREREGGPFSRSIELPSPVDRERVDAQFQNGLLSIVIPLAEETKPRQIPVKTG